MKIREWAKGRWPEIISALVGDEYTNTRKHFPCPSGEGTDCFRFSDKGSSGNFFCRCSDGTKDGFELLQCVNGWDFAEAARQIESVIGKTPKDGDEAVNKPAKPSMADRLREGAVRTKRSAYLERRGLEMAPGLQWHRSVPYFDADRNKLGEWPAMLAPITRGSDFLTYHITYLQDGGKAPLDPCRKIVPANGSLTGAACELYPAGPHLGIAEGVETAIAAKMLFGIPVWAALNAPILGNWEPPQGVKQVTVFGDHDANYTGHAAAYKLANRLSLKGIDVRVQIPGCARVERTVGMDWNDWLLQSEAAA